MIFQQEKGVKNFEQISFLFSIHCFILFSEKNKTSHFETNFLKLFFTIECLHKSGFCLQLNQLRLVKDIFCFNLVRNSFSFLSSSFSCHLSVSLSLSISHLNIMSLLLSYYLCLSVFPILTLSFSMLPPLSFSLLITQYLSQTLFIAYLSHFHSIFT